MTPFTAVVVLHDSASELRALLASLEASRVTPAQLIVVDSGSTDGGVGIGVAQAAGAQTIQLAANLGFGAANNAGVSAAEHDVTILLNPDIVVRDGALDSLAAAALARDALHVPRLLNTDGSVQRSAHPVPGTTRALLPAIVHPRLLPRALRWEADPWRAPDARAVGWAIAACVAARTSTLRELGPFDAETFLFFEDLDLCLAARAAGRPTILHPDLVVTHTGGHSTGPALGTAHALQARRRREVIAARLGRRALVLDDAAQALTFGTRAAARMLLRRGAGRERAQLGALREARRRRP